MTTLGKYELHEQLGKGGFGTVYRATDTTLDRIVALKVLHPQLMVDDVFINRFKKEARALAALENHHIVTIYEIGEMDGRISIAMRYLAGGNLKQVIKNRGPLPLHETSEIILQVLKGLKAAHEHGFIHRDLKPENILSDGQGEYVITDLGLVRDSQGSASSSTGGITGTPNYIAPEIWRGQPATPSTDIYSVGCILYELLTGRVLFDGDTPAYVMMKHLLEGPQLSGSFLPEVKALLQTALAQDPAMRFSSAREISATLRNLSAPPAQPTSTRLTEAEIVESVIEPSEEEQENIPESDSVHQPPPPPADQPAPVGVFTEPQRALGTRANLKKNMTFIVCGIAVITLLVIGIIDGWFTPKPAASATEALVMLETDTPTHTVMPPKATKKTPTATSVPPTPTEENTIRTQVSLIDGMTMVYVPAGEFLMGSPNGVGDEDEHPQHTVYLDAYWIDQTEVTNAMYEKCVADGICTEPSSKKSFTSNNYYGNPEFADYPVIYVNWSQAETYCAWAGSNLPTEAQWEKAARGGDGWTYPWGDESPNCDLAHYVRCHNDTIAVGSLTEGASPYGALGMAGNVWEWVADWYGDYLTVSATNPQGPTDGEYRVLRGGSWLLDDGSVRAANRLGINPDFTLNYLGFRCALPASQEITNETIDDEQQAAMEEPVTAQSESKTFEGTLTRDVKCRTGPDQYLYGYDVVLEPQEILIDGRNEEGTWLHFTTSDGASDCWTIKEYVDSAATITELPLKPSPGINGQVYYGFTYSTCNQSWHGDFFNGEPLICETKPSCHLMLTKSTNDLSSRLKVQRFLWDNERTVYEIFRLSLHVILYSFPFTTNGIPFDFYSAFSIDCPQMNEENGAYVLTNYMP